VSTPMAPAAVSRSGRVARAPHLLPFDSDHALAIHHCAMRSQPFITKLYTMAEDPVTASIFSWTDDGTGVVVHNVERFVAEILPHHFRHGNLSSFVRQMNTYDFHKFDKESFIFKHEHFRRGSQEELYKVQRKSSHRPAAVTAAAAASTPAVGGDDDTVLSLSPLSGGVHNAIQDQTAVAEKSNVAQVRTAITARIAELSEQVKQARAQQQHTRDTISSIMTMFFTNFGGPKAPAVLHITEKPTSIGDSSSFDAQSLVSLAADASGRCSKRPRPSEGRQTASSAEGSTEAPAMAATGAAVEYIGRPQAAAQPPEAWSLTTTAAASNGAALAAAGPVALARDSSFPSLPPSLARGSSFMAPSLPPALVREPSFPNAATSLTRHDSSFFHHLTPGGLSLSDVTGAIKEGLGDGSEQLVSSQELESIVGNSFSEINQWFDED